MGSSGNRTPRASHSVCGYRFRLLGDRFKIKSVTPCHSQSGRGTQPWGGGKCSASPWEGEGWGPRGWEEKSLEFFPFLSGGRGRSPVGWDSSGQKTGGGGGGLGVNDVVGWEKESNEKSKSK